MDTISLPFEQTNCFDLWINIFKFNHEFYELLFFSINKNNDKRFHWESCHDNGSRIGFG